MSYSKDKNAKPAESLCTGKPRKSLLQQLEMIISFSPEAIPSHSCPMVYIKPQLCHVYTPL